MNNLIKYEIMKRNPKKSLTIYSSQTWFFQDILVFFPKKEGSKIRDGKEENLIKKSIFIDAKISFGFVNGFRGYNLHSEKDLSWPIIYEIDTIK